MTKMKKTLSALCAVLMLVALLPQVQTSVCPPPQRVQMAQRLAVRQ